MQSALVALLTALVPVVAGLATYYASRLKRAGEARDAFSELTQMAELCVKAADKKLREVLVVDADSPHTPEQAAYEQACDDLRAFAPRAVAFYEREIGEEATARFLGRCIERAVTDLKVARGDASTRGRSLRPPALPSSPAPAFVPETSLNPSTQE